jgi:hypothetical protein
LEDRTVREITAPVFLNHHFKHDLFHGLSNTNIPQLCSKNLLLKSTR